MPSKLVMPNSHADHAADMLETSARYEPFGLSYDPSTDQLRYNGHVVHHFENINVQGRR